MNDPVQDSILEAIGRLDQAATNRFLGSLLAAEVSLQRLPVENFAYARDEHEKDGGVDGHLELPTPQTGPFPEGRTKWQFKSGSVKPTAKRDVLGKTKGYLRDQIRAGADFVLAWTQSPPDKQQQSKRKEFAAAVKSVRSDARAYCFFGVHLAEMALRHPGVVADFGLSVFGSLLTIEDWERHLPGSHVSFLPDQPRTDLTSRLRDWADSVEAPHSLYVFGSAGVGKSRTVLEAFKPPGLSERVLYAPTPDSISPSFWPWILGHKQSRLCLVVDECSIERLSELQGYANATSGRLRLVALGDRGPNRGLLGGAEFVELQPVAAGEMEKALQDAFGLSSERAAFVANLAQGYPGLAWSIVQVLAGDPTLDVTKLSRSGSVGVLLNRMLPVPEHRQFLGILALFSNVGFDGDVGPETDAICTIFNADVARFRQVVRDERDLVGVTGRYRHVTPLLFAIWVGSERLAAFQSDLRERLDLLPDVLFVRFQEQLESFGPNEHAKEVVRRLLEEPDRPFDLSELASYGRLLRAAAAVDRELVMGVIERSVARNRSQLASLGSRLDLGWTLEYLAWWPDTFHGALGVLFWLAIDKVPGYTDQSVRHLTTLFQLHLGGTSVPFSQRLDALQEIVAAENSDAAKSVGCECLATSLTSHEVRIATTIRGGTPLPDEWRPSPAEVLPLRQRAFNLRLDWALAVTKESGRESALLKIAGELPTLLYVLPGQAVLPKLEKVDWQPKSRAKLAQGIHMVLAHDTLDAEYASTLRALAEKLRGDTFDSLLGFVFSASPWELAEGREERLGTPEVIQQLGDQLASDDRKLDTALTLAHTGDPPSVGKVFERLAETTSKHDQTYKRIVAVRPVAWAAIAGYLVGRDRSGDADWVTQALRGLTADGELIAVFPVALAAVEATDERASIALASIEDGGLRARDLIRLKFGLWVLGLGEELAIRVIEALAADDDEGAQEAALALLDQYSEERAESKDRLRDLAAKVLMAQRKGTPISSHYRQQLTARFAFDYETRLQIFLRAVEEDSPHMIIQAEAELFDGLIKEQPRKTVKTLVDRLVADVKAYGWSRWAFSLEEFHFLSRAVRLAGKKPIAMALRGLSQEQLATLLPHFSYEGLVPDPLLVNLIESGSEDLRRVATGQFFHSPNGWTGSRIPILERRRSEAEVWSKVGRPSFKRWASSLVLLYDRAIPLEAQNEAEFDASIR